VVKIKRYGGDGGMGKEGREEGKKRRREEKRLRLRLRKRRPSGWF
jgi:hypothetical protein